MKWTELRCESSQRTNRLSTNRPSFAVATNQVVAMTRATSERVVYNRVDMLQSVRFISRAVNRPSAMSQRFKSYWRNCCARVSRFVYIYMYIQVATRLGHATNVSPHTALFVRLAPVSSYALTPVSPSSKRLAAASSRKQEIERSPWFQYEKT